MATSVFHVVRKSGRYGPYSLADLDRLAEDGRLTWADLVEDDRGRSLRLGDVISDLGFRYEAEAEPPKHEKPMGPLPPAVARILGQTPSGTTAGNVVVPRGSLRTASPTVVPSVAGKPVVSSVARTVREESWDEDGWDPVSEHDPEASREKDLNEEEWTEEVSMYRGKPSAWNYPFMMILVFASVGLGWWAMSYHMLYLAVGCGMASLFLFSIELARCQSVYLISNQRVEVIRGLFSRSSREIRIRDIRAIDVEKSGWRGLINIGTVFFSSAGSAEEEVMFEGVSRPHHIKKIVRQLQGG